MSEDTIINPVETPAAEPKLGKPKLAKAKKAAPKLDEAGNPVAAEPKAPRIPRVSPYAGKSIYLNRENELVGPEGKNPKRPGTNGFTAFSQYVEGNSVEAQIALWKNTMVTTKTGKVKPVGDMADIRWDSDHGFIVIR